MPSLLEIEKEILDLSALIEQWAEENDGDITECPHFAAIDALQIDRERKILSLACLVVELEGEAGAIDAQIKRLQARKRTVDNRTAGAVKYLLGNLQPGEKLKDARVSIGWRKSESVQVSVPAEDLPEAFRRTVTSIEADKKALKEALKEGAEIPGAALVEKLNLQIK